MLELDIRMTKCSISKPDHNPDKEAEMMPKSRNKKRDASSSKNKKKDTSYQVTCTPSVESLNTYVKRIFE